MKISTKGRYALRMMVDMAQHQILPAAIHYTKSLCETVNAKRSMNASCRAETALIDDLSVHTDGMFDAIDVLKKSLAFVPKDPKAAAQYYHDTIIPNMQSLRIDADILESLTDRSYWPYPTYSDLLYY